MRAMIDLAHRVRRKAMAVLGVKTRGVKVMAFDVAGRLVLVRHRYGSPQLMLPGGGVGRRETPAAAAAREIAEEIGCTLAEVEPAGIFAARAEGRRDTVHLFRARLAGTPQADGIEIAEVVPVDPDALPDAVSPATRRRIDEWRGRRQANGRW
ncbi:8-oxo-dGTP pyrophosphatase MutT (NUDIX family) [Sphingomonas jinjuensis]|uniref:8-oxo-dGTP pyrophosphatase MutT (NUDIX family) n=1 Tax=Sphingomonas jinjuensis TaxID=535907 RepID=A0A840FK11_9SPHN|nr:NUDIX domain-containing protein [Sphingomonas jinjuensis]MBB4154288.1 8-oxo-dGTP pyrophosphatase MutT (NUDIX family) [Sphingomonas jinjuensis]